MAFQTSFSCENTFFRPLHSGARSNQMEEGSTQSAQRGAMYKNKGMTCDELRKRRESNTVQLRKQKRDFEISKRRNIDESTVSMDDDFDEVDLDIFSEKTLAELFSDDAASQESAMRAYRRRLMSDKMHAPIDEAIALGLVERFVTLLTEGRTAAVRRDAVSVLGSIVAGTSAHTDCVVQSGVLPTFIALLSSEDYEMRERSLLAIGNIAGDQCAHRDLCISHGAVPAVIRVLTLSAKTAEIRNAVWTMSNLCRGKNPPPPFDKVSEMLPSLAKQLFSQDPCTVGDACRAIAFLSDGDNSQIEYVVQSGVVRRLVELLMHPNVQVYSSALRAVGNIVTGTDQQTQVVLSCSALGCLQKMLQSGKESTKKEVCWTLSNILAGNRKQIQAVIDAHILPSLVQVLSSGDFKTRKEACWAISNALSGGSGAQVAAIVREGAVLPLCDLLTVMEPRIVKVALSALENILRHGENIKNKTKTGINPYCVLIEEAHGLEKLEFLQQSPNLEIYVKAFDMIETFFAGEEQDEDTKAFTAEPVDAEPISTFSF